MLLSVETLTVLILTQIESIFSGEIVTPSDGVHIGEKVTEGIRNNYKVNCLNLSFILKTVLFCSVRR